MLTSAASQAPVPEDGKITIGPAQRNTGASAASSSRVSASKAGPR